MEKLKPSSTAQRAADIFRTKILSVEDGDFLGSEDELAKQLGISKPTFRQAALLLEQEQLLLVKRGVGGGYYARRPDIDSVVHAAAIYLHCSDITMQEAFEAVKPNMVMIIQLAAQSEDEELRQQLQSFVLTEEEIEEEVKDLDEYLSKEVEFAQLVSKMTGNPMLQLFVSISYDFAFVKGTVDIFKGYPDRMREEFRLLSKLASAILSHDLEQASVILKQRDEILRQWIKELSGAQEDVGLQSENLLESNA